MTDEQREAAHEAEKMSRLHDPAAKAANKRNAILKNRELIAKARAEQIWLLREEQCLQAPLTSLTLMPDLLIIASMHTTTQGIGRCMTIILLPDYDTFYVRMLRDAFVIKSYRMPLPPEFQRKVLLLDAIVASEDAKMAPKRPDLIKKQERVKKILDEPAVQEKMKKKVDKKRDRKCIEAIVKAGGDDSHPDVVKFVA